MKDYLTIGEVSKLTHLPISTLRYYDKEGIITPYYVDENTKYRYYRLYQIAIIKMVIHLKKLGFSNEYIKEHLQNLDYKYTLNLMNEMITKTQKEIERLKNLELELIENTKRLEYLDRLSNEVDNFFEEIIEIDSIYTPLDSKDLWNSVASGFAELDKILYKNHEGILPLGFYAFTFKFEDLMKEKYNFDKLLAFRKYENYEKRYCVSKKKYICLVCQGKFQEINQNIKKLLNYMKKNNYKLNGNGLVNIMSGAEFQKNPFEAIYILKFPVA